MNISPSVRGRQRGFGLIDSLIALVVVCVGLLGITAMHLTMNRAAEALRQRGEATRLAQALIETSRVPSAGQQPQGQSAASDTLFTSNATRNGTELQVAVSWQDRAGQPQSAALATRIAELDSSGVAMLALAPPPAPFAFNGRSQAVPIDAQKSAGGRSLVSAKDLAFDYQVADVSGDVTARCPKGPTAAASSKSCEETSAYLVSGFIRFGPGVPKQGLALDPEQPLLLLAAPSSPAALDCSATEQTVWRDPASGHTVRIESTAAAPEGYVQRLDRFIAYICVVTPVDGAAKPRGSGTLQLNPAGWRIGTEAGSYQVRPLGHTTQTVSHSLDQQNFLIVAAGTIGSP